MPWRETRLRGDPFGPRHGIPELEQPIFLQLPRHPPHLLHPSQSPEVHPGHGGDSHVYQHRTEAPRYSRRVEMAEIEKNDFNLNISRYISTATAEQEIDLTATNQTLIDIEKDIKTARDKHNQFLKELNLPPLP
jgi:hypothetical protein